MKDWYFAGMFDQTYWGQVGRRRISGEASADVLRQIMAEAGDTDLTWLATAKQLDALCRFEYSFEIKRKGERIVWVLNPFRDQPQASGFAETVAEAIDALVHIAQPFYSARR